MPANAGVVTRKQAAIWIPIILAIISVASVYALYAIDDIKNRDTILYAKFLANLKDRWRNMRIKLHNHTKKMSLQSKQTFLSAQTMSVSQPTTTDAYTRKTKKQTTFYCSFFNNSSGLNKPHQIDLKYTTLYIILSALTFFLSPAFIINQPINNYTVRIDACNYLLKCDMLL